MNYHDLPLFHTTNTLTDKNYEKVLTEYKQLFPPIIVDNIGGLMRGDFNITGNVYSLSNLIVSDKAKTGLFYPQAFFIFEAQDGYFTQREGLDSYELRYTLSGKGHLEYDGKKTTLNKGDGYWIDCRKPHYYYASAEGWTSTVFHINGTMVKQLYEEYISDGNIIFRFKDIPSFEMLQHQVLLATQKTAPYIEYRVSCLIHLLLTELLTAQRIHSSDFDTDNNAIIISVIDYIREHYTEKINIDKLAHQFGISRTILYRQFKKYTGFSPSDYILELRMNQAKFLLKNTKASIEEISARTGFHDAAHFSQIFKKRNGYTPMRYRKL